MESIMQDAKRNGRHGPWTVETGNWTSSEASLNGSRFLTGNGYLGYRGTLEEHGAAEQVGCILNGVYDQAPGKWREPVNAPNGLYIRIREAGSILSHHQSLDIRRAVMSRNTVYETSAASVHVRAKRFVSQAHPHLLCLEYAVSSDRECEMTLETGIDTGVWDINGPHFGSALYGHEGGILTAVVQTNELGIVIAVSEAVQADTEASVTDGLRVLPLRLVPGRTTNFWKYVAVFTSPDCCGDPAAASRQACEVAVQTGFDSLLQAHAARWEEIWNRCGVEIDGDDEARFALRYSIYQLQCAAPRHSDRVSIPARGLSGQVYKGAVFWDTEMFMTPVFTFTEPAVARNLILYRYHTLDGARRKAAEYGFRGAFYAWESQETGDDACTLFNVSDVFTGRPMRTYFRDKQIHISADIVYAITRYLDLTGDDSILAEGAAEVAAECARFLYSYAVFKPDRGRFELHDVTGPDEYHERVNNNAFTNRMAKHALTSAVAMLDVMKRKFPDGYGTLDERLGFSNEIENWQDMAERLYQPAPDTETGVIPQFDGYMTLEDPSLAELKKRMLDPNEYLGGGNGLATQTRILKQADVVLMLHLFPDDHPDDVVRANWEYYEPRTEHGSSLSACAYAMVAARIGRPDWAYDYFMKTATVDLTGKSKQFVGDLYIGGTHPAANGGAWLSAVLGFAGLRADGGQLSARPSLPSHWTGMEFPIVWRGRRHRVSITRDEAKIEPVTP
jgi:trehalose/maltose hydrolase-like predicted phosphorylase